MYVKPNLEIMLFAKTDIICTSNDYSEKDWTDENTDNNGWT